MRQALVFLGLFTGLQGGQPPSGAPTIITACGSISGASGNLIYQDKAPYFSYSTIPYAAPPIGPLRFRPPQPYSCPWNGTRDGTQSMVECIQTNGNGSEDCLQLNVYVPGNHSPSSPTPLPVLVYFHGGNLIGGSAPTSSLAVLAVQSQVIAVGVNYRLNTLGFLALDDLAEEEGWVGNQGIADAIAALTWVRDNIGVFGGDPKKVTLAGQSSGGTLIFALFAAPRAAGLFTGAISMSGSPNITMDATTKRAQDAPLLGYLGCSEPPTPTLRVACLRALNASTLGQASNTVVPSWGTPGIFGWSTPPGIPTPQGGQGGQQQPQGGENYAGIVHVDGELLTQPFDVALASGLVPSALIISNMESEGDGSNHFGMRNANLSAWEAFLKASFELWPGGGGKESTALLQAYSPEALVDPDLAASSINSDYGLTCAGRRIAGRVASAGSPRTTYPLYLLFNAYQRSGVNATSNGRWPYHGLDWTAMGWGWGFPPTPSDFDEAILMQSLLRDFAYGAGILPSQSKFGGGWNWPPPVTPGQPLSIFVVAQEGGFPGGGSRPVVGWKEEQCSVLESLGFGQNYWWCD